LWLLLLLAGWLADWLLLLLRLPPFQPPEAFSDSGGPDEKVGARSTHSEDRGMDG